MRVATILFLCCLTAHSVRAGATAPPPPFAQQLARADAVLVVKVTAIEEKPVKAERLPGMGDRVEYRIAVVTVEEAVLRGKGLEKVRIGIAPTFITRGSGGVPRGIPAAKLAVGQQALVLLTRHPVENFWVMPNDWDAVDAKARDYKQKLDIARRGGKLFADPLAGLKAKDEGARLLTAVLLLGHYFKAKTNHKLGPIPAEESAGILRAIAGADWSRTDPSTGSAAPLSAFSQLTLREADGWRQPADYQKVPEAAREWLKANAEKYRIMGYIPAN